MATQYYYVTQTPGRDFVATLTLSEIRDRLGAGTVRESFHATESDGRSFSQFQRDPGAARWRTLAELLGESPRADGTAVPAPARWLSSHFLGGGVSWFLLGVGQIATLVACVAIPIVVVHQLGQLVIMRQLLEQAAYQNDPRIRAAASGIATIQLVVIVGGILGFFLNAALFVVFRRANTLARVAVDQDAENQRLWQAITELQAPTRSL